jgi:hypothetical protein
MRQHFNTLRKENTLVEKARKLGKDDSQVNEIQLEENEYFEHRTVEAEPLARKLTADADFDRRPSVVYKSKGFNLLKILGK